MTYSDELNDMATWPKSNRPIREMQREYMRKFVNIDYICLANLVDCIEAIEKEGEVYGK